MWHMTGCRMDASSDVSVLQPLPRPLGRGQLFTKKFQWTLSTQCPHRLAVAPCQVLFQLFIQFFHIRELFPIVKVSLVIPVTALDLTVVPWRPGRDQLVRDARFFQCNVKGTLFCIADVFVSKLRAI